MESQDDIFRGTVDRVTGQGYAIIQADDVSLTNDQQLPGASSEINLGEIPQEVTDQIVGETVEFVYRGGNYGMLVEDEWTTDEYKKEMKNRIVETESHGLLNRPKIGETFTAKVDRISNTGNGIIQTFKSHINIGPVLEECVGEQIEAEMVSTQFARCKTEKYKTESYENNFPPTSSGSSNTNDKPMQISSREADDQSDGEVATIGRVEFCRECGSIMRVRDNSWVCSSCGYEQKKKKHDPSRLEKEHTTTSDNQETNVDSEKQSDESRDNEFQKEKLLESSSDGKPAQRTSPDTQNQTSNIDELREKAERSAVEEVPEDAVTTTTETTQYNRSSEVREYVKTRADGECEGCGKPAPFTSKTGEPYLHAHHIYELSDGGSDTPDTVVALCPNCHYRVHHGEDGDEYNQELLEIVQKKENQTFE